MTGAFTGQGMTVYGKPKAVWLVAGGPMQRPAAMAAKDLGLHLIVSDRDPECPCSALADAFFRLDTFDIRGHLAVAETVRRDWSVEAVFTAGADCHWTVATLAKRLGCHGLDPALARSCRFKHETRRLLQRAGIPQPPWGTARTLDEARRVASRLGGPFVVKATDNSGSRGFSQLENPEALDSEVFRRAVNAGTTGVVLLERALEPDQRLIAEQSVETLWYNGKMYWLNWVDRIFGRDLMELPREIALSYSYRDVRDGIEIGHVNPSQRPEADLKQVHSLMDRVGRALGFDRQPGGHILKGDIFWTDSGPFILEITPRLSGGWDSAGSTLARGANFIAGALRLALGEPLTDALWHACFRYAEPACVAAVLAAVPENATDCIGRRFSLGTGRTRDAALLRAWAALQAGDYLS